jgi:hypothetical protein
MVWTPMPETTINEDSNLDTPKDYVGSALRILERLGVDGVSKPHCMQQLSDAHLSRRIALRGRPHSTSDSLR